MRRHSDRRDDERRGEVEAAARSTRKSQQGAEDDLCEVVGRTEPQCDHAKSGPHPSRGRPRVGEVERERWPDSEGREP